MEELRAVKMLVSVVVQRAVDSSPKLLTQTLDDPQKEQRHVCCHLSFFV